MEARTKHETSSIARSVKEEPLAPSLSTLKDFFQAQKVHNFCRDGAELVDDHRSCFHYDRYEELVWRLKLNGILETVVLKPFRH